MTNVDRLNRRLMYRPNPPSRIDRNDEHKSWPFVIEVQGSANRADWGQLVGKVWAHSGDHPDVIETPEYYARLFAAAPKMLVALREIVDAQSDEAIKKAKEAIADATERSSCRTCNGSTENFPCKTCNSTGMVNTKPDA